MQLDEWAARDPIALFEKTLRADGALPAAVDEAMRARIVREIDEGLAWAEASPEPDPQTVADGVVAAE